MNKPSEATLVQRARYLYRQLLVLQRLFEPADDAEAVDWLGTGDPDRDLALCAGIRELLDQLTEQARVLTTVPFPLRDWRPGDGPDDERWRGLTEVERREILSLVAGYENLIAWADAQTKRDREIEIVERRLAGGETVGPHRHAPREGQSGWEFLEAERIRLERFRQEMGFLERRRPAEAG